MYLIVFKKDDTTTGEGLLLPSEILITGERDHSTARYQRHRQDPRRESHD